MAEYESASSDLAAAIRLGYEAERDDPNLGFVTPSDEEIRWLGAWLASEGFARPKNWHDRRAPSENDPG